MAGHTSIAQAGGKAPAKGGGGTGPSKDDIWAVWPGKGTDKHVSHESCGAPSKDREWQDTKWVYFTRACAKVGVQMECGCTKFTTTFKKYDGAKE